MTAYYNEIDPYAAQWLRNLVSTGHIAPGDVDERSIVDIRPADLAGYDQCHFFAGIGVWSAALRDAGWPDDKPVWTGSCPCQPFSAAGKRGGFADERHLWPAFFHLIRECRPAIVFGEQVASPDGLRWLDLVSADLEGEAYPFGAADLCAAGVTVAAEETQTGRATLEWVRGAVLACPDPGLAADLRDFAEWFGRAGGIGPAHIRQRLCWMAYTDERQRGWIADREGRDRDRSPAGWQQGDGEFESGCAVGALADHPSRGRREECPLAVVVDEGDRAQGKPAGFVSGGTIDLLDISTSGRCERIRHQPEYREPVQAGSHPGPASWTNLDWIICMDGKARPVEPGTFPLAHGAPARVGRLRAYGNAMHRAKIARFVEAAIEAIGP